MVIIDDDMKEDSVNSSLWEYVNSHLNKDALSHNDLAFADSCLNKNLDASNTDWSSIKEVLSEILSSQLGAVDSVLQENNTQLTINSHVDNLTIGNGYDEDEDLIEEDDFGDIGSLEISDDEEGNLTILNKRGRKSGQRRAENVFRPNYTEGIFEDESNDTGMDLSLSTWEVEPSSEDIFKVWDLGISDEQDDFTKQLNKAYADSTAQKDVMHVCVDDLVGGLGDLSLKQNNK